MLKSIRADVVGKFSELSLILLALGNAYDIFIIHNIDILNKVDIIA